MARTYSDDWQERDAATVLSDWSCRQIAATFDASVPSAIKMPLSDSTGFSAGTN